MYTPIPGRDFIPKPGEEHYDAGDPLARRFARFHVVGIHHVRSWDGKPALANEKPVTERHELGRFFTEADAIAHAERLLAQGWLAYEVEERTP